jgi:hypothetical protein
MADQTEPATRVTAYLNALPGERSVDANGCIDYAIELLPNGKVTRHDLLESDLRAAAHPGVTAELEHAQATLARVHDVLAQFEAHSRHDVSIARAGVWFQAGHILAKALGDGPAVTVPAPLHYTLDGTRAVCGQRFAVAGGQFRLAFDPQDDQIDCAGCRLYLAGVRAGIGGV